MSRRIIKKLKSPIVLIVSGVLTLGFVCPSMLGHESMHIPTGSMAGILMVVTPDNQECCNTSISKHIESWKDIALTLPDKARDAWALLMLGLALILGYGWVSLWSRRPSPDLDVGQLRLYIREHPDLILFDHLKLAFARGILNPKIY